MAKRRMKSVRKQPIKKCASRNRKKSVKRRSIHKRKSPRVSRIHVKQRSRKSRAVKKKQSKNIRTINRKKSRRRMKKKLKTTAAPILTNSANMTILFGSNITNVKDIIEECLNNSNVLYLIISKIECPCCCIVKNFCRARLR